MVVCWSCFCDYLDFVLKIVKVKGDEFEFWKFNFFIYGYGLNVVFNDVLELNFNCCLLFYLNEKCVDLFSFVLYVDGVCWGNGMFYV